MKYGGSAPLLFVLYKLTATKFLGINGITGSWHDLLGHMWDDLQ